MPAKGEICLNIETICSFDCQRHIKRRLQPKEKWALHADIGQIDAGKVLSEKEICPICKCGTVDFEPMEKEDDDTMQQTFYKCSHCGNIIAFVKNTGVPVVCCGEKMAEIIPGAIEASAEKHIPIWMEENGIVRVKVGSVEHPMLPEHYIEWVSLQTKQGNQRKELHPGEKPEVCFAICQGDEIEAVYACCNLHGLWKA